MSWSSVVGLLAASLCISMASSGAVPAATSASHRALFAADVFGTVAESRTHENVVLSPISIQTCLALAYIGAKEQTELELKTGLRLVSSDKSEVAGDFEKLFADKPGKTSTSVRMANKIYANKDLQLQPKFVEVARRYFASEVENLDFARSEESVNTINRWVEGKTNNKIQNLLQPGAVDADTSALLVNAIHFKALWKDQFSEQSTQPRDFWVSDKQAVKVPTMIDDNRYKYGDFPEFGAAALEMEYEGNDNMSMMLIVPERRDGLAELERKLKNVDLLALSGRMRYDSVEVFIPRFKAELTVELKDVLRKLGINSLFTDTANLSGIFKSTKPVKVSDVVHKAFIDVNEAGSEAAAATFLKIVPMSLNLNQKTFKADHPFVWLIKDNNAIYFMGHVAKF